MESLTKNHTLILQYHCITVATILSESSRLGECVLVYTYVCTKHGREHEGQCDIVEELKSSKAWPKDAPKAPIMPHTLKGLLGKFSLTLCTNRSI